VRRSFLQHRLIPIGEIPFADPGAYDAQMAAFFQPMHRPNNGPSMQTGKRG
jgi:hypothetical protein